MNQLIINAFWDDGAGVWVAASEDVRGLATEAETIDALVAKLKIMIPELLTESRLPGNEIQLQLNETITSVA